ITLPLRLECGDFRDGFYQVALVFRPAKGLPLRVEIHWAISSRGKVKQLSSEKQIERVVQLAFTGKAFTPPEIRLGGFYSKSGNRYICESTDARRVYLQGVGKSQPLLMSLMAPGVFHYFLSAGERLHSYFFHDNNALQINSIAEKQLYYDSQLQHYQREKSLFDHFTLIIEKPKKVKLQPTCLPEWLTLIKCKNHIKTAEMEFQFNPQAVAFGENRGEIKMQAKNKAFMVPISCQLLPPSIEPVSIAKEIDLTQAPITDDDILQGHIPIEVIGVGKLSVSLGDAAVTHNGFIADYRQEPVRTVRYPIKIDLNKLTIDKVSSMPLKVYLGSLFDDRKVFKTTLLLRKKTWKRTIRDVIGSLHIFKGQQRKYAFEYTFHEGEQISDYTIELPKEFRRRRFSIQFTNPQFCIYRTVGKEKIPFLFITRQSANQFCIEVLTTHVPRSFAFDIPLLFELKTDKRTLRDRIDVVGQVLVADIDIKHEPETGHENAYYRHGALLLTNPSKSELCVYSFTCKNAEVRMEGEESFLNFPIILQPGKQTKIRYSYLVENNHIPTVE
ncbi:MAG: hypothetical protein ACE5I1_31120, partial [bacterium]